MSGALLRCLVGVTGIAPRAVGACCA
jgi:hypothetical protein